MASSQEEIIKLVKKHTFNYQKVKGQFLVNNGDQDAVKKIMASSYHLEITPAKQKRWNIKYWRY